MYVHVHVHVHIYVHVYVYVLCTCTCTCTCIHTHTPVDEAVNELGQLGARHLHVQVLRARLVGGEEGEVDLGVGRRRELALGLLGGLAQPLNDELVLGHIETRARLELGHQVAEHSLQSAQVSKETYMYGERDLSVRQKRPMEMRRSQKRPTYYGERDLVVWHKRPICMAKEAYRDEQSTQQTWSKSSPPRCVSPLVDLTSNTPPFISRMDTSNVPPPRSYTAMVLPSSFLSAQPPARHQR